MPLAPHFLPKLEDLELLLQRPLVSLHVGVDHVDPPLATLARFPLAPVAHSLVEFFSNPSPLFWLLIGSIRLRSLRLLRNLLGNAL